MRTAAFVVEQWLPRTVDGFPRSRTDSLSNHLGSTAVHLYTVLLYTLVFKFCRSLKLTESIN